MAPAEEASSRVNFLTMRSFLKSEQIRCVFRMRGQITRFQRVLGPLAEVVGKLGHLDLPCVGENANSPVGSLPPMGTLQNARWRAWPSWSRGCPPKS